MPNSATLSQALGAAFCAILCALSGMGGGGMMIGARTAVWAKADYTARDYVQDGLIAMWDGIENVGLGIPHDSSSKKWIDITGNGYDLSLDLYKADGAFSEDGIYSKTNTISALYIGEIDFDKENSYAEVVFSFADSVNETWGALLSLCDHMGYERLISAASFDFRWRTSSLHRNYFYYGVPFGVARNVEERSGTYASGIYQFRGSPDRCWLNNEPILGQVAFQQACVSSTNINFKCVAVGGFYWSSGGSPNAGSIGGQLPTGAEVKAIRIYSEPITASQMAINYVIDKARFNLT